MKKLLVASIAAAAFCSAPAFAADMPVKGPVYKAATSYDPWTGCYVGGNAGGGWGHEDGVFVITGVHVIDNRPSGFVGGGQLGCDYQSGSWVVGARGLFDWSDMKKTGPEPFNPAGINETTKISYFGTATGRLGFLVQSNALLYVDGGFAWAKYKRFEVNTAGVFQFEDDSSPSGWTVGGGLEWIFAPKWSLFIEYDYLNFGTKIVPISNGGSPIAMKDNVNVVLVGLNYRFGGDPWGKASVSAKY